MSNPGLPEELAIEAAKAFIKEETKTKAAESLGLAPSTFRNRLKHAARLGMLGTDPVMPGFEISKVSEVHDRHGNVRQKSIHQRQERSGRFNVPDGHKIVGVSSLMDSDGRVSQQWVKTSDRPDPIAEAKAIGEAIAGFEYKPIEVESPDYVDSNLATVYPLADLHLGLLAWGKESGKDWNLPTAIDAYKAGISRVMMASPNSDTAVILGIGDLLHADGFAPLTAKSNNVLDVDSRYPRVLFSAAQLFVSIVAMALEKHKHVVVRGLGGNHDERSAIAITLALSMKFSDHQRVHVDESPSYFWWWEWGKNLLGATHGDKAKVKDLPLVMANDCPKQWGRATNKKIYTGHFHQDRRFEDGGVIVECLRSPSAKDAYHASNRYRSGRSLYSDTFHKDGSDSRRIMIDL